MILPEYSANESPIKPSQPIQQEQLNENINKLARQTKYDVKKEDLFYTWDVLKKIKYFINSYRFLSILNNNDKEQSEKNKIEELFIKKHQDLYKEALSLYIDYKESLLLFKQSIIRKKIEIFVIKNELIIHEIIDFCYSFGKQDRTYDPDESVGYYVK